MALTFAKGTTVILFNGTASRELLVESITASQTFLEDSRSVKTLHVPNNVQDTFTNQKSAVSVEFSCLLTPTDSMLFEWFGFSRSGNRYNISPTNTNLPTLTLFIKSPGTTYKVSTVYATTLGFKLDPNNVLGVTVSATGSDLVTDIAPTPTTRQTRSDFLHGSLNLIGHSRLAGITCEVSKEISWVEDKTIHSILAGIHKSTKAICTGLAIGGSITNYKRDNTLGTSSGVVDLRYAGKFSIYLGACKFLDRWDLASDVHKKITDYKLLHTSTTNYVEFTV
jgi:hypothetical protein